MRPLFGYNRTNKNPSKASEYITKTISKALENEYDEIAQASFNIHKKLENKVKKYSKYIILFGVILLSASLMFGFRDGFVEMWQDRASLLILGAVALVVGILARIFSRFIKPKKELLEDLEWNKKELDEWLKKRAEHFEFDENIYQIDILHSMYTEKNGVVKPILTFGAYNNVPTVMYIKNNNFCVSDNINVYEFPLSSLTKVELLEEHRAFTNWTKKEEYTQEFSKELEGAIYKKGAMYHATKVKKVIFTFDSDEYYFEILPYDFEKLSYLLEEKENQPKEENLFEIENEK